MYIDTYGVIVQKDMDGGDTLHREGMYAFGLKLRYDSGDNKVYVDKGLVREPAATNFKENFKENFSVKANVNPLESHENLESLESRLDQFEVSPGIYIRHPDPHKWYSNPEATSRDQVIPVIAYCAAYEDYPRLWRLFKATLKRGMFAQNTLRIGDGEIEKKIPDPMQLSLSQFIRAGGWWTAPLYPLLMVFDTIDLVGTLLTALPLHFKDDHWVPRWRMDDDVDDNNTVVVHLLAALYKPTPISALNRYLYSVTRAQNFGNSKLGESNAVMGALRWYHRSEYDGEANPEIAELYRPLIEKYFTYQKPQEYLAQIWRKLHSEEILVASEYF